LFIRKHRVNCHACLRRISQMYSCCWLSAQLFSYCGCLSCSASPRTDNAYHLSTVTVTHKCLYVLTMHIIHLPSQLHTNVFHVITRSLLCLSYSTLAAAVLTLGQKTPWNCWRHVYPTHYHSSIIQGAPMQNSTNHYQPNPTHYHGSNYAKLCKTVQTLGLQFTEMRCLFSQKHQESQAVVDISVWYITSSSSSTIMSLSSTSGRKK